jgi:hypothetical protein
MSFWTWFVKRKKIIFDNQFCFLLKGDYERSKNYGERSFTEAVEVNDPVWQLNAKVLVAHSQTKLRQYREAEQTFDEALVLAKDQRKKKNAIFQIFLLFYQKTKSIF